MANDSRKLQDVLKAARERLRRGKGIAHDQFWKSAESGRRRKPKSMGRRKQTLASLLAKAKGPSPHRALDRGKRVGRELI